jgi:hypothetical protein
VFLVIEESPAVSGTATSMAVLTSVCNAVEILAGRQVRGQEGRVLVPRGVFEIVLGSRRPVHGGQGTRSVWCLAAFFRCAFDDEKMSGGVCVCQLLQKPGFSRSSSMFKELSSNVTEEVPVDSFSGAQP